MDTGAFEVHRDLCSFTPVRRRESTVNTRRSQGDQAQAWTAARCHRLLRALTSRVTILNKELARSSKDQVREAAKGRKQTANTRSDVDWARAKKRIRQTYSKKSTRADVDAQGTVRKAPGLPLPKERESLVPGEIAVLTPILARARGQLPAEEVHMKVPEAEALDGLARTNRRSRIRCRANNGESRFELSEPLPEIRKRVTATQYSTYEGIYSGLEALLWATTTSNRQPEPKSPRSLLSMSLRAMPRYIAQQEALLQAHLEETGSKSAIENRDISAEIYDELETLGSCGNSWKKLKTLVRSHGILVVSDAIQAGLLDVEFSGALIALCVNTSAIDEAQTLLSALLTLAPCARPRTPYDLPCRPLAMLWKFAEQTGRYAFQYRQLTEMISNDILPIEWLATKEFGPVWTRLVHSLTGSSNRVEAMAFLDLTLSMLLGATRPTRLVCSGVAEAVRNTFSSLLTILSAIVILNRGVESLVPIQDFELACEYEHLTGLLQSCAVRQSHLDNAFDHLDPLLLLANLFMLHPDERSIDFRDRLLRSLLCQLGNQEDDLAESSPVYSGVVDFISRIARCCGRGTSTSGFEHLQHLHLLIESFTCAVEGGEILKILIVDSAFAFAQKVSDRKHLDYATVIDESFCARRFGDKHSHVASQMSSEEHRIGFRWEEGIGEWVTATPSAAGKSMAESPIDDLDYTPFQPSRRVRLRKDQMKISDVDTLSNTDQNVDYSALSKKSSEGLLDELGSSLDSDSSAGCGLSPRSDNESVHSISAVGPSFVEVSYVYDDSSLSIATDSAAPEERLEAINPAPRPRKRAFRNGQDWSLYDESTLSSAASSSAGVTVEADVQWDCVDRAPRLGRRALRSSQAWQIFDESDDELSFLSASSQGDHVLRDITNTMVSSTKLVRKAILPQKWSVPNLSVSHTDSEDELCI